LNGPHPNVDAKAKFNMEDVDTNWLGGRPNHGPFREGQQIVLPLAQFNAHSRVDSFLSEMVEQEVHRRRLRPRRRRGLPSRQRLQIGGNRMEVNVVILRGGIDDFLRHRSGRSRDTIVAGLQIGRDIGLTPLA
jgi:hypothetical protein